MKPRLSPPPTRRTAGTTGTLRGGHFPSPGPGQNQHRVPYAATRARDNTASTDVAGRPIRQRAATQNALAVTAAAVLPAAGDCRCEGWR